MSNLRFLFAALFIYDAVDKYFNQDVVAYTSILLGATAVFMFFFRRKFSRKFDNRDQSK